MGRKKEAGEGDSLSADGLTYGGGRKGGGVESWIIPDIPPPSTGQTIGRQSVEDYP